ncbi:MAG TPA: hypothetical protein VG603_14290 [Chitinophagales bacterium]|nr:hypothetical protein [Chitinophagales bacterium]
MRNTVLLIFFLGFVLNATAQIKVDSNYTVLYPTAAGPKAVPASYITDFNDFVIKENSTGIICKPASMQVTLLIGSEAYHPKSIKEVGPILDRAKPKDKIFLDHIKMPDGCFAPPKSIVINIM